MELNISDLLDDLREVNVDIRPHTAASESRIKELTMRKIQTSGKYQRKRNGMGFAGKLLIAAVIITTLAVPVLAASGTQFTDWIEGIIVPRNDAEDNYDNDLLIGSTSKKWVVSGWAVEISAEDSSATGLTFVCKELGDPSKSGTLTTNEGYWLEKWNGTEYVAMDGTVPDGAVQTIPSGETVRWDVSWESVYGKLDSGSYRIGKTFTYTSEAGEQEQMDYYAKFRIFGEEITPLMEKYEDAYEELYDREIRHMTWTHYSTNSDDYAHHYTSEIWRYGDEYLMITSYYNEDNSLKSHRGYLLRDGLGYELFWADGNVHSQVVDWKNADFVEPGTFDRWYHFMNVIPVIVGQVYDAGNTLYFIEYSDWINENDLDSDSLAELNENSPYWNHDYTEMSYVFDESGRLYYIQYAQQASLDPELADTKISKTLEVHDTSAEEIAKIIESQNVSDIPSFSWSEDSAKYGDSAITEGFVNTAPQAIGSIQDAVDTARREADPRANPRYREGYEYNVVRAAYDASAGIWRITFGESQDDDFILIVYLTNDGTTRMLVYP